MQDAAACWTVCSRPNLVVFSPAVDAAVGSVTIRVSSLNCSIPRPATMDKSVFCNLIKNVNADKTLNASTRGLIEGS